MSKRTFHECEALEHALFHCVNTDDYRMESYDDEHCAKRVKELVAVGATPCAQMNEEFAIHRAAFHHKTETIIALIQLGANVNVYNESGKTPVMVAIESLCSDDPLDSLIALLDRDYKVDSVDENNNTALHCAVKKNMSSVVELLLRHGANPKLQNVHKMLPIELCDFNNKKGLEICRLLAQAMME